MAIPIAAQAVASVATEYGPAAWNKARAALAKVTNGAIGKAAVPAAITKYVGSDPRRLQVVAEAALPALGVSAAKVWPEEAFGSTTETGKVRERVMQMARAIEERAAASSVQFAPPRDAYEDAAQDNLRRASIETIIDIFGTYKRYVQCLPNGGVPKSDFVWYAGLFRRPDILK